MNPTPFQQFRVIHPKIGEGLLLVYWCSGNGIDEFISRCRKGKLFTDEEIIAAMAELYSQSPESAKGIYERSIAR